MAHVLDAVIKLDDQFSGVMRDVEKNVGEFGRTFKKMGRDMKRTGSDLMSLGGQLTAKVTTPVIAGVTASITEYAKLEQSIGGVETLFKGSAGQVIKNSQSAYKRAGVSANDYMENITSFSASLLQGLGGDTKKAAKIADMAMVDMSDNANKMGTSIQDIQNAYQGFAKDNFTMLDNLKLGYGGTAGEMARLINDTGVMGKGFKATAKNVKDIPFDKMIEAVHKVQGEMDITGTTTQEAMETVSGSVGMAKASIQDFLGGMGNPDADIDQLAKNMVDSIKTAAKNIKKTIGHIWDNLPLTGFQKELLKISIFAGPVVWIIGKLTSGVGALTIHFGEFATSVKKVGFIQSIFTPGAKVAIVITLIVIAVILLIKNWDKLKEAMKRVKEHFDKLKSTVNEVKNKIIDFKDNAIEKAKTKLDDFKQTLEDNKGTIKAVAGVLTAIFGPALVQTGVKASVAGGKIAGSFVANIIKTGTQAVVNGAKLTASFIASMVKAGWEAVIAAGKITVSFIGSLIKTAAQAIVTAATISGHLIVSMVQYAAQGWKTVASIVATTAAWIAQKAVMIGTTVATYAAAGAQKLLNAVMAANPILLVIGLLAGLVLGLIALYHHSETARNIMNNLWNGIKNGAAKAKKAVHDMVTKVKGYWNDLKTFLKNPIKGTVNIVQKGVGWVKNKVGHNAYGTNNWGGGLTWVGEQGPELINLPRGSKVYPTNESASMAKGLRPSQITIAKLADQIVVREDADIDRIATALVKKLDKAEVAYGGGAI
jgi:phage-related protein